MRKLVVLVFMLLYSVGNILFPCVDMAHLQEQYAECAVEDPDINVADFVFEHLLNIPEMPGGQDEDEHEKPHQSAYVSSAVQVLAIVARPQLLEHTPKFFPEDKNVFNGFAEQHLPTGFSGRMLRPPIV